MDLVRKQMKPRPRKKGMIKNSPVDPHKSEMTELEQQNYDNLRTGRKKFEPDEAREFATNPIGRLGKILDYEEAPAREGQITLGTRKGMRQLKEEVMKQRQQKSPFTGDLFGKKRK